MSQALLVPNNQTVTREANLETHSVIPQSEGATYVSLTLVLSKKITHTNSFMDKLDRDEA
jgi:hypothetical protein